MTPSKDTISRISFGKMTNVQEFKMSPCLRGKVGALLLEKKVGTITEDVALVFDSTIEIDKLISKLKDVKRLMFNEER